MSSAATIAERINALVTNLSIFIQVWGYSMIFLGCVGHVTSVYVLTRSSLRLNPCSRYFLASTIAGFFVASINIPVRILQVSYNINIPLYSNAACKTVTFILFLLRGQTSWFIVLASIDRFLCSSSSTVLRAWSSRRVANRAILIATLIGVMSYTHVPITYNLLPQGGACYVVPGVFETISGIWLLFIFSIGPCIFMLVFGMLTIRNIRKSVGRVMPFENPTIQVRQEIHRRPTDRSLIQMLLGQCIMYIISTLPYTIINIYTTISTTSTSNALQKAIANVLQSVSAFIAFLVPCTSFYLFVLFSKGFRRELLKLFKLQFGRQQAPLVTVT